jgi:hypothetical protein
MRELVRGKNTIGPEVIDPGGRSVEKPREVTLTLTFIGQNFKGQAEYGTDGLSRNVGNTA